MHNALTVATARHTRNLHPVQAALSGREPERILASSTCGNGSIRWRKAIAKSRRNNCARNRRS